MASLYASSYDQSVLSGAGLLGRDYKTNTYFMTINMGGSRVVCVWGGGVPAPGKSQVDIG